MLLLLLACATCDQDTEAVYVDTEAPADSFDVTTTTYTCEDDPPAIPMDGYATHAAVICYEAANGWFCDPDLGQLVGVGGGAFCVGGKIGTDCIHLGMDTLCDYAEREEGATDVRLILNRIR